MNNAFIAIENASLTEEKRVDNKPQLRAREAELVEIVQALEDVLSSRPWQVLKSRVFDGVLESLLRQRDAEVEKKPLNGPVIHSLNGQIAWAKKYSDLSKLADIYKLELRKVKELIHAAEKN